MNASPDATPLIPAPPAYRLTRRFSIAAFASVVVFAGALGWVLSGLLHDRLLARDAEVTSEFVQSIVRVDETATFFRQGGAVSPALEDSFRHFAQMPDVLRANVYTPERTALWSSDRNLQGRKFEHNDELDDALAGRLVFKSGYVSKEEHKAANAFAGGPARRFVEIYVPVRDTAGPVVGVVELYKTPDALFLAIAGGQRTIAIVSALGGLTLFAVLLGIVRRADRIMQDQQRRLLEGERLGAVGEMAATVAHAIRNPLSSIRTSVEVAVDPGNADFRESAEDIVTEVDRIEEWIRQLLVFSRPGSIARETLDPNGLVKKTLSTSSRDASRVNVKVELRLADPPPSARGDGMLVEHVLVSLVGNAIDAMAAGGTLTVTTRASGAGCEILVADTGPGIRPKDLPRVFEPFYSTKTRGTGLGLALARRLVERMGGTLTLANGETTGAVARLHLPA
ncbi:MAG: two-component sensor histidine kinase [Betaproteobacteria bacterium]|nr:two-component sensor histidine kinase [Betaproteobacteria bacterium]